MKKSEISGSKWRDRERARGSRQAEKISPAAAGVRLVS